MGYDRATRREVGPVFSEASRLLWLALEKSGSSAAEFARTRDIKPTFLHKLLYGERKPGRAAGLMFEKVDGIGSALWDVPPKRDFVLPANRPSTPPHAA